MVHNIVIWSSPTRDHAAANAIANNAIAGVNSIANQKGSHCWDAPEDDQLAASTVDALAAATSWRMASTQMMKVSARRSSGAKEPLIGGSGRGARHLHRSGPPNQLGYMYFYRINMCAVRVPYRTTGMRRT